MVGRIQIKSLILFVFLTVASYGYNESDILVSYSFDDNNIETGPDTFHIFENAKGCVDLSDSYRFSGYNSVQISDVVGDKDFPELQGYFPTRKSGKLYIHFAFLTTDINDLLNIALAGPKFFNLTKDGIGFWLKTKDGYLYHVSDSMPKKLIPIIDYRWYSVDVTYDIDLGTYDLQVREENYYTTLVDLKEQKNATNNPNSVVNTFSFVTDPFTDNSALTYYVDDIIISLDEHILKKDFVAPGRKKFFVDMWDEYRYQLRTKPGCLPAVHPSDFGLDDDDISALQQSGLLAYINNIANGKPFPKEQTAFVPPEQLVILTGIYEWSVGCRLLREDKSSQQALEQFRIAQQKLRNSPIVNISSALVLARLKKWDEANDIMRNLYFDGADDLRIDAAQALIGMTRNDLGKAEEWLHIPAENVTKDFGSEAENITVKKVWAGEIDRDVFNDLKRYMPEDWEQFYKQAFITEQYYYALLWQERNTEAMEFCRRMIERLNFLGAPTHIWEQRLADAAFYSKDYDTAKNYYERILKENVSDRGNRELFEKLSDVYFLTGNYDKERLYREKIYGSLIDKKCD